MNYSLFQRSAILLLCIFTATSADISLISLGTQNAADDGYIYNRPSIPFDLPQKEVIIKPNPGSSVRIFIFSMDFILNHFCIGSCYRGDTTDKI